MGCATSRPCPPLLISLDGNIGAGKSTLLTAIKLAAPELTVLQEPVGDWLTLKNEAGESLLSLFYKDTPRWAYTFQNCAILTRLIATRDAMARTDTNRIMITERSVLTDRYVFAEMMVEEGKMSKLEWDLYMKWFDAFAKDSPIHGIIHITTDPTCSKERIVRRGRSGEDSISLEYLTKLDQQHKKWISTTSLPTLSLSTEDSLELNVEKIRTFCKQFI
jgi:deoxyadenosine/deoxycytidine kinase